MSFRGTNVGMIEATMASIPGYDYGQPLPLPSPGK